MKSSELRVNAIVLCAGTGSRTNLGYNKILYYIGKKTVLETVLDNFASSCVKSVWVTANSADIRAIREIASSYPDVHVIEGGATRTESVRRGLRAMSECDIAVIHDGARPYASPELIDGTVRSASEFGSGIAAVKVTDTIKESDGIHILRGLDRNKLYAMQTPQTFSYSLIKDAYDSIQGDYTDDAEIYSLAGHTPRIVEGEYSNTKITTAKDLFAACPARTRIGVGFDVHTLAKGRKLIIGGVEIPHVTGLEGHSDADVLVHAVMDALLGAAALPDIGVLFPNNDPATEGIDSMILLDKVVTKISDAGYAVANLSAVIMAQSPKMAPHIDSMRNNLATHLGIRPEAVGISATTTEKLGIIGEEKGIAASATVMLYN